MSCDTHIKCFIPGRGWCSCDLGDEAGFPRQMRPHYCYPQATQRDLALQLETEVMQDSPWPLFHHKERRVRKNQPFQKENFNALHPPH